MTAQELDDAMFRVASGWDGAVGPRTCIALLGALVIILTLRVFWKRECSVLVGGLWLLVGAACVTFSIIPQAIVTLIVGTDYFTRIRVVMGGLSVFVLLITLESIRRTKLQERYAILWVMTGMVVLVCALFPHAVNLLRAVVGMQYATAVVAVAFIFLVMVAFHFSIAMSAMESDRDRIAQRLAVLETRMKELEERIRKPGDPS